MYHYIDDKEFLSQMKAFCSGVVSQLVNAVNNDSLMKVEARLVGSGAKTMITQNEKEPIDLDYNLSVLSTSGISITDGKAIKEHVQKHFNKVLKNNGLGDCQDSTSALTTPKKQFKKGNKTTFSIDLAIVRENNGGWERLIHEKTGTVSLDRWYWNEASSSKGLAHKVTEIKNKNLWLKVREVYLKKKDMYLQRNDQNHPSFIVYIETVNEVYGQIR